MILTATQRKMQAVVQRGYTWRCPPCRSCPASQPTTDAAGVAAARSRGMTPAGLNEVLRELHDFAPVSRERKPWRLRQATCHVARLRTSPDGNTSNRARNHLIMFHEPIIKLIVTRFVIIILHNPRVPASSLPQWVALKHAPFRRTCRSVTGSRHRLTPMD